MPRKLIIIGAALVLATCATAEFALDWSSIDGGATTSAGPTFTLTGTIGQPDTGQSEGATWSVDGGYLVGTPPESAPCPADLDGSGDIGFGDLLVVLSSWGACAPPCAADLDGSGDVGFGDLLAILAQWGACPE